MLKHLTLFGLLALADPAGQAAAQESAAGSPENPTMVCGTPIGPPANLPQADSGPVLWQIALCFEAQGNVTLVDPQTYLYYMQLKVSTPETTGEWVLYTEETEEQVLADFHRLYNTNFLDDLSVEVLDYVFSNGVLGKIVVYNLEERQRVKNVVYTGSDEIDASEIDEVLRAQDALIRLDTFIDAGLVKKVEGIVRSMLREKGFQFADVTHEITALSGGPKLVDLAFHLDDGPQVKIRQIEFEGNQAASDRTLKRRMKANRQRWFFSFITGRGTYQETRFAEDAERVLEYYRDRGYITAQVGDPELNYLEDSDDGKTRWVELRIPVVEGNRYRVGEFTFDGNTVVEAEDLRELFDLKEGDFYSQSKVREGFEQAQIAYGSLGYYEFTGYPDNQPRDLPNPAEPEAPAALAAVEEETGPPIVDVTMRLQEGDQFFVNRIVFQGNTVTRDNVIRRELRLYENGVFDTEALKYSVRRINQLGYFTPLEGPGGPAQDVTMEKTPGVDNKVDVTVRVEEQNRNQLSFGAGVSQFEGFFGQLSFQTSNFLGRGESLTVSMQGGSRAKNYTLAFTEPFLFDRNISGGLNLFRSDIRYIGQFTQSSVGGTATFGFPLGRGFTRMFVNYSYERVRVTEINDLFTDPLLLARNPFLRDSLLLGQQGQRTISKVVPTILHNTVDQPIFPTTGKRFSLSIDLAGLGGNTKFYKPSLEALWFLRQNARMSLGIRGMVEYLRPWGNTAELPIFQKLFLGGEYSVRGFDIRSIGPSDPLTGLVLGGNKSLLLNVEQTIHIAGPVRLIFFYDAGQVRDTGESFAWMEEVQELVPVPPSLISDPFAPLALSNPAIVPETFTVRRSAFKTSTGAEVRFFMPVLNVPFRLIFAHNPQRGGVLDNQLEPQKAFQFRFAVGTTF